VVVYPAAYYYTPVYYSPPVYYWGWNGCFGCYGCHGCFGGIVVGAATTPAPTAVLARNPGPPASQPVAKAPTPPDASAVPVSQAPTSARLKVRLPADAKLYVDDVVCPLTSDVRSFPTPPLPPGQQFQYTLRAEVVRDGQKRVITERVLVSAGQTVEVNLTNFNALRTVQR